MDGRRRMALLFASVGAVAAVLMILLPATLADGDGAGNPLATQALGGAAVAVAAAQAARKSAASGASAAQGW